MGVEFNTNIKLLAGGIYCGNMEWSKKATSIDNCFKFYCLKRGCVRVQSKNENWTLEPGKYYFINGHKLDSQFCSEHFVVNWIHFLPQSLYFKHILSSAPLVTSLGVDDFASFTHVGKKLQQFFSNTIDDNQRRLLQVEIQAFIYFLISKVYAAIVLSPKMVTSEVERLMPALDYIAENFSNTISLENLAEQCCLSPNYFHRLFSKYLQVTPSNYIRDLRMDEAVRQLAYTTTPVKVVAFNVGYDDEAYFSRVFSKKYGVSPGKYRKGLKTNIP